jgi:hypothetical protein
MSYRVQNVKNRHNDSENECGSAKRENWHNDLETVENESGIANLENYTLRAWYHWKWVLERKTWKKNMMTPRPPKKISMEQNFKNPGIVKNEFGSVKHEK